MGYGYYVIGDKECGYMVDAVCEEPGCDTQINRGLAYACGGEPGEVDWSCDGYFCYEHLIFPDIPYCGECDEGSLIEVIYPAGGGPPERTYEPCPRCRIRGTFCRRCCEDIEKNFEEYLEIA